MRYHEEFIVYSFTTTCRVMPGGGKFGGVINGVEVEMESEQGNRIDLFTPDQEFAEKHLRIGTRVTIQNSGE